MNNISGSNDCSKDFTIKEKFSSTEIGYVALEEEKESKNQRIRDTIKNNYFSPYRTKFRVLAQQADILPEEERDKARINLGKWLGYAADSVATEDATDIPNQEKVDIHFQEATDSLETKITEYLHSKYIKTGMYWLLVILLVTFIFPFLIEEFLMENSNGLFRGYSLILMGAAFGAIGAAVSLAQRYQSINISKYASKSTIYTQSGTKIILGAGFGLITIVALSSNLLSADTSNPSSIIIGIENSTAFRWLFLSTLAGISERLGKEPTLSGH